MTLKSGTPRLSIKPLYRESSKCLIRGIIGYAIGNNRKSVATIHYCECRQHMKLPKVMEGATEAKYSAFGQAIIDRRQSVISTKYGLRKEKAHP